MGQVNDLISLKPAFNFRTVFTLIFSQPFIKMSKVNRSKFFARYDSYKGKKCDNIHFKVTDESKY